MAKATVKAYASSGCVLLTFDWASGNERPDFLGFAIRRTPGYSRDGSPQFLLNKLDFIPLTEKAKPKPSDAAPIQKFNWWDGGINSEDRGKTFEYTVIPVLGTGPTDLALQEDLSGSIEVKVPNVLQDDIATYFNRAVVSAQSFLKLKNSDLQKKMEWLANGLQDAVPEILGESDAFDCAIYHLSDNLWILPAFEEFSGRGSIIYFDKGKDLKSRAAITLLKKRRTIFRATNATRLRSSCTRSLSCRTKTGARPGLAAVIEDTSGHKSYWALAHPPGKADFHHSESFALQFS